MNHGLWTNVKNNVVFVLVSLAIAIALFAIAYLAEKLIKKKNKDTERILTTRKIAMIGVFSAIAAVLMLFEFPVPFAPFFYELDFSEIPALIGTFAFGPVAGIMIEFCKILLKLFMKGTSTAFVGDLANFVIGCSFILPASIIYLFKKTKKNAIAASVIGTLVMTVFGTMFNAVYLLPAFATLYGWPLEEIVGVGTEINSHITSVSTLVLFAVAPLNLLKGGSVSLVTMLVYKKLSPILKEGTISKRAKTAENIKIIPAYDYPQEVVTLFSEYTDILIAGDSSIRKYLDIQHYDEEIKHLEIKYGMPYGRLYLAYYNGELAGCIGLRKIDELNCEMKRFYVRPAFRGKHIGDRLIRKIIKDAKEIGYFYMLLDTLPFLDRAIHIYKKFGFYEIESYNDSPMNTSIYMKLDLKKFSINP